MSERPKSSSAQVWIAALLWFLLLQSIVLTGVLSDIRDSIGQCHTVGEGEAL